MTSTVSSAALAPLTVALSSSAVDVAQNGASVTVNVSITRPASDSAAATLAVTGLPAGITAATQDPGAGNQGSVTFQAVSADAGSYPVIVTATDVNATGHATGNVTVDITASIATTSSATLNEFVTTSFQPAEWDDNFFSTVPAGAPTLDRLGADHIRIQALSQDIPQVSASSWDFTRLDGMVGPIQSVTDHSPEFQIAVAPAFMYSSPNVLRDSTYAEFAAYSADLVRYYNTGGFTDGNGVHHQSSSAYPITYWGIYNEPNLNGLSGTEYTKLYNETVPQMQAVDPTIKFVAVELSDFGSEPEKMLPPFVQGVTAHVDIVATHYYGTCNQKDSDQQVFDQAPVFADHVRYIYSQLKTNVALANVPVWVTENNVNADFDKGGGISACNGTTFVRDLRGSDAYFAAWRPYVYSQLAKAGAQALYHWEFEADQQYGEVDSSTATPMLSYWVDYYLSRYFGQATSMMLDVSATETKSVELMAAKRADGSVALLIANHAVLNPSDNNGPGAPRTIIIDISNLGNFSSATELTMDGKTSGQPQATSMTVARQLTVTLGGYGSTFVELKP